MKESGNAIARSRTRLKSASSENQVIRFSLALGVIALLTAFGCSGDDDKSTGPSDTTAPTVASISPAPGVVDLTTSTKIVVIFSEAIDANTVTAGTFQVEEGAPIAKSAEPAASVPGQRTVVGNKITFVPTRPFKYGTNYVVKVTSGIKDIAGNSLAENFASTFATLRLPVPLTVVSVSPQASAEGVAPNSAVTVTFSESVNAATVSANSISLTPASGGPAIAAIISVSGHVVTLNPTIALSFQTNYSLSVTTAIRDVYGNALVSPFVSAFTTQNSPDTTPPHIVLITPANGTGAVVPSPEITVAFSEKVTEPSVRQNLQLFGGAPNFLTPIASTVTLDLENDSVAILKPSQPLALGTVYQVTINGNFTLSDQAGNIMQSTREITFTTAVLPEANAGVNVDATAGEAVSLSGTGVDPNNAGLNFQWTQLRGIPLGSISPGPNPQIQIPNQIGAAELQLVVTDNLGLESVADRMIMRIWEDATGANQFVEEGMSIQAAIDAAINAGSGDVYIASGNYHGVIQMKSSVSIYGSFSYSLSDPDSSWLRGSGFSNTWTQVLVGGVPDEFYWLEDQTSFTVYAGTDPYGAKYPPLRNLTIDGFQFWGYDRPDNLGEWTAHDDFVPDDYGIVIEGDVSGLTISNCVVFAGSARPGEQWWDGVTGAKGIDGAAGQSARYGSQAQPGSGGQPYPGESNCANGGDGGRGMPYNGSTGGDALYLNGLGSCEAAGGRYTCNSPDFSNPGEDAPPNIEKGSDGYGGIPGRFHAEGWYNPMWGDNGGQGQDGYGGGGGSAGCGSGAVSGAGGGGGGGGGGKGGVGGAGWGGGASIAILVQLGAQVNILNCQLCPGNGGDGSDGGLRGLGGSGGIGGPGGSGPHEACVPTCQYGWSGGKGGNGSDGTIGGNGGSGCGGSIYGIVALPGSSVVQERNSYTPWGQPGKAGKGLGNLGTDGESMLFKDLSGSKITARNGTLLSAEKHKLPQPRPEMIPELDRIRANRPDPYGRWARRLQSFSN